MVTSTSRRSALLSWCRPVSRSLSPLLILIGGPSWLQWAAAALAGGALVAFVLSRTVGLFGFSEQGWQPSPHAAISVVAELVVVGLWAVSSSAIVWPATVSAEQIPGMHDAFALHLDVAAFLEYEATAESFVSRLRHLNASNGHSGLPTIAVSSEIGPRRAAQRG